MTVKPIPARTGVWLVGARGGLATTLIAGLQLVRRGLAPATGLVTETPFCGALPLPALSDLVVGGHDIRDGRLLEGAQTIARESGTIPIEALTQIEADLEAIDADIRIGTAHDCGEAIARLATAKTPRSGPAGRPAAIVERLTADLVEFRARHGLARVIVVNLASTEPPLELRAIHQTAAGVARLLAGRAAGGLRASALYALAAFRAGCPFINFTPSNAALIAGVTAEADAQRVPYMGDDGKTGETLVKSALAPMFKYRNLRVLSWQGYNILGDQDGLVLSDERNKASKLRTKDSVLSSILGYPLHTHVGIDYVPSLGDLKTAWDFVHFQGFLNYKMSLQFTWQGCDAILAAPLVLDMIRLTALAHQRGEAGPMKQLACFFKRPVGVDEQDLHMQFNGLLNYVAGGSSTRPRKPAKAPKKAARRPAPKRASKAAVKPAAKGSRTRR